jgi:chitodextrinase
MRFNDLGFIDARNGSAYVALSSIPYSAGAVYRFRLLVNPQNHTYSAWVTPPSSAEIQVANNYAFRTEQAATSSLNSWTLHSGAGGTHNICNFSLTPGASDTQPPTVPTGLTATAVSTSQINLSWTASTDNVGVTGYRVERCQGAGCTTFVQIATPTGTTFSNTGLIAATSYSYRVKAVDAASNVSVNYSNVASATTLAAADTTPPTAPGTLTATAASRSRINLTWAAATDNVGVTGYRVERCQGATCTNFVQVGTPTGTSFGDTGLTRSTTYRYRVRASDAAGNLGPYSGISTATTKK